ncbi:TonB-dependent receptor domain-containing protein [Haliea sp. E17]|uniref:TonB-dependent receptor domain-containing protein n=1 Tax=Haliea sp. E17 TaxID=3401576 RepID=UPI003AAAA26B
MSILPAAILLANASIAQSQNSGAALEEVVVVGSQIQGARITGALPVSVVSQEEIQAVNAVSGDDLFRSLPAAGDVTFNGTYLGGGNSNAARGDVSTVSLRGLAQGNTLVLINGRRSVVHPTSQTDNQTPVFGYNINAIPVAGLKRVEILKDGAAALYGTDAVAGVVNNVLQDDFVGLETNFQYGTSENDEWSFNTLFGTELGGGRGNASFYFGTVQQDELLKKDQSYLATADLRPEVAGTSFADVSAFNGLSGYSGWGQFKALNPDGSVISDPITSNGVPVTRSDGNFQIHPASGNCAATLVSSDTLCVDDSITSQNQDLYIDDNKEPGYSQLPSVERYNFFSFVNYDLTDKLSFFGELGYYWAKTEAISSSGASLGHTPIFIPADNYYNPFGPVGSPNRLAGLEGVPDEGLPLEIEAYRYLDTPPRKVEVENSQYRILGGLRGDIGAWNWESAVLYNEANVKDSQDHISSQLIQQALALTTPDAYNPFAGGDVNNVSNPVIGTPNPQSTIDSFLITAVRENTTSLALWDFKISRPDLFSLWAGDVGVSTGVEYRKETYEDDRDSRQDTSSPYVDIVFGGVYPSDLMGHSPSPDVDGDRDVMSAYLEFSVPVISPEMGIPLVQAIDLQLAGRYEDYSDVGTVTTPKIAGSWDIVDGLRLRGSWSEGFKAPNLEVLNIPVLARSYTRTDNVKCEADLQQGVISDFSECNRSLGVLSERAGNPDLEPEDSTSYSFGVVFEPTFLPERFGSLIFTVDKWEIEQTGIVGVLSDQTAVDLDYYYRMLGSSNPNINRQPANSVEVDEFAGVVDASGNPLAAAGTIESVNALFFNLLPLKVGGIDFGVVWDTSLGKLGDVRFNFNGTKLTDYYSDPTEQDALLASAQASGVINGGVNLEGTSGDLIGQNGNPELKWTLTTTWDKGPFQVGLMTKFTDAVEQPAVRNSEGKAWKVDSQTTYNLYGQYTMDNGMSFKIGARNLTDEDPPLAAGGYMGNLYQPYGRYVYASIHKSFF